MNGKTTDTPSATSADVVDILPRLSATRDVAAGRERFVASLVLLDSLLRDLEASLAEMVDVGSERDRQRLTQIAHSASDLADGTSRMCRAILEMNDPATAPGSASE